MTGARMRADMAAQPAVLAALAARRSEVRTDLAGDRPAGIVIVARGSSDYAAIFGRYLLEAATGLPVALAAPSLQTLYGVEPRVAGWLAIGISQSGRTPEIVTMLERFGAAGARTVAVTNDVASPLADVAGACVGLDAGVEGAVPATKTFTAQLAAMALIAEALGPVPFGDSDWERLPGIVEEVLADGEPAERAAARLAGGTPAPGAPDLVCIARGYLLCVALEAALKLREAAGVRAEGWSAADFRHGPMTVARGDLPLLAISAAGPAKADVGELTATLRRSGTLVQRLSDEPDAELPYPAGLAEPLSAIPATVRAQQLALALALRRGADPDEPPGLSKVTPTE
jgi:glucosamine--fructose-6-phosphate aminotransferase (isomerizing)